MNTRDKAVLERGQRVGLALAAFQAEINSFEPLQEADAARAELVAAIEARADEQGLDTSDTALTKEQARELMARGADTLSNRAVAYALSIGDRGLKQALSLSYSDVRYGDAAEDLRQVRALVNRALALSAEVRQRFRLTPELIQAPADAADRYEQAEQQQLTSQSGTRLAALALPALLGKLRTQLELMQRLTSGMRTEPDPRWEELYRAFTDANKVRGAAGAPRQSAAAPVAPVRRRLLLHRQDNQPARLARTNFAPTDTVTVENRAGSAFLLWMAQADGQPTTPQSFPAGQVTTVTRAALGPETARYLTGRFEGADGGEVKVVVRRGVA